MRNVLIVLKSTFLYEVFPDNNQRAIYSSPVCDSPTDRRYTCRERRMEASKRTCKEGKGKKMMVQLGYLQNSPGDPWWVLRWKVWVYFVKNCSSKSSRNLAGSPLPTRRRLRYRDSLVQCSWIFIQTVYSRKLRRDCRSSIVLHQHRSGVGRSKIHPHWRSDLISHSTRFPREEGGLCSGIVEIWKTWFLRCNEARHPLIASVQPYENQIWNNQVTKHDQNRIWGGPF